MTDDTVGFPRGMLGAGRVVHRLLALGIPLGPLYLLETRGRRTDVIRTVPVALLHARRARWLVSPFGDVAWVRNVRANGHAVLTRGRRRQPVRLTEVTDDRNAAALVHRYRATFSFVPFVRAAFATGRVDPHAASTAARDRPVFHVDELRVAPPAPDRPERDDTVRRAPRSVAPHPAGTRKP